MECAIFPYRQLIAAGSCGLLLRPSSPKRGSTRRDTDLYYYYAGFSQSFVEQKIRELNLPPESLILDPWCGSGTTLAAAQKFGYNSFGSDINPVSLILTKSRFASSADVAAACTILQDAIRRVSNGKKTELSPDVLLWRLRVQLAKSTRGLTWSIDKLSSLAPRYALILAGLFFIARYAARGTISRNPSWHWRNARPRLSVSQLRACWERLEQIFRELQYALLNTAPGQKRVKLALTNLECDSISASPIADAVITSPPYLTRVDYGISTALEWRLLKGDPLADLTDWRSTFTGSVLTFRTRHSLYPLPRSVSDFLLAVHRHKSKAAQTYYFYFFRNYFVGMQNSICNLSSACKIGATGLFVIQDSHFKDLSVPLTDFVSDMLHERGWSVDRIEPFSISPTFYKINSRRWIPEQYVCSENVIWARRVR